MKALICVILFGILISGVGFADGEVFSKSFLACIGPDLCTLGCTNAGGFCKDESSCSDAEKSAGRDCYFSTFTKRCTDEPYYPGIVGFGGMCYNTKDCFGNLECISGKYSSNGICCPENSEKRDNYCLLKEIVLDETDNNTDCSKYNEERLCVFYIKQGGKCVPDNSKFLECQRAYIDYTLIEEIQEEQQIMNILPKINTTFVNITNNTNKIVVVPKNQTVIINDTPKCPETIRHASNCIRCGEGWFNLCDEKECMSLGTEYVNCIFVQKEITIIIIQKEILDIKIPKEIWGTCLNNYTFAADKDCIP